MNSSKDSKKKGAPAPMAEPVVGFGYSSELPALFTRLRLSLFVSTHQAQRVLLFSSQEQKVNMLMRVFPRPTGMALSKKGLALCTQNQVWEFDRVSSIQKADGNSLPYDITFAPRRSHVTGNIDAHEIAWCGEKLVFANTRFSCLAAYSENASFVPIWKPPFISEIVAEDRCHLNGIAVEGNDPRYVTAMSQTNTAEGWRQTKLNSGVLIEVSSGRILCQDLCMPHSPRIYQERLWVLSSGDGQLLEIDRATGTKRVVATLPGFVRGLSFFENYAFIGLSGTRSADPTNSLPIEKQFPKLECAVYVIDLKLGTTVGFIRFTKGIEELFDVQVLSGYDRPHLIGMEDDAVDGLFVLPNNL